MADVELVRQAIGSAEEARRHPTMKYGGVAEWFKAPHSKCGVLERVP